MGPPMTHLLLLLTAAFAHQPHDVAAWVAVPPGDDGTRVTTTLLRNDGWLVIRSENLLDFVVRYACDAETTWTYDGRYLSGTRLVVGTEGQGLLVSEDGGDTFAPHADLGLGEIVVAVEASPGVLDDGLAYAAGGEKVWRTRDAGMSWEQVASLPDGTLVDLDLATDFVDSGRLCVLDVAGRVACSADRGDTWTEAPTAPPDGGLALALGEGDVRWVGTHDGLYRSSDGGARWEAVALAGQPVVEVEDLGDVVLATSGMEAVWASVDQGASWEYRHTGIEEPGTDQPSDNIHYFDLQETPGGRLWLGSWEGPAFSDDRGETWHFIETEPISSIRSVSLTRGTGGALSVLLGTYGGGVTEVDLDLTRALPVSQSLSRTYMRHGVVSPDWGEERFMLATSSDWAYVTRDGGETWQGPLDVGAETAERVALGQLVGGTALLVVGETDRLAAFSTSLDAGATWTAGTLEEPCGAIGADGWLSEDFASDQTGWAACLLEGKVYRTTDAGASWEVLGAIGVDAFAVVGTPTGDVFVGARDGLYRATAGGAPVRVGFEGKPVFALGISPRWREDPALLAVVLGDGWYRSDDGGTTWTALVAPTADVMKYVSFSPDFVDDDTLAVAGYNGAWASRDRGATWFQVHALEVVEEDHPTWSWETGWGSVADPGASAGRRQVAALPGSAGTLRFRGVGVTLLAPTGDGLGRLSVDLDGAGPEEVGLEGPEGTRRDVWSREGLPDAWHELRVTALDAGASVDAAEVLRVPLTGGGDTGGTEPPKGRDCGCGAGGAAGRSGFLPALLALVLVSTSARRRRG